MHDVHQHKKDSSTDMVECHHDSHVNENHSHEHSGHSHVDHHRKMLEDFKKRFVVSLILTFPILLLSGFIQGLIGFHFVFPGSRYVQVILATIIYLYGGYPFLRGLIAELNSRSPGMMTLIGLAISVAYIYSVATVFYIAGGAFFWELATLIDIMLLGHWIEMKSVIGASKAIEEISKLIPDVAHLVKDGEIIDIPTKQVKKGDRLLVKPGERIPADGIIVEGETSIDESMITGESQPVYRGVGDRVIGGSINLDGSITVEVTSSGEETYLSKLKRLIEEAQREKTRMQDLADKAALLLTIIAIVSGTLTFILWVALGYPILFALERMVTVMVITCPHALGLAVPLVIAVSTANAARNGFVIRDRKSFERARNIDIIVFDKTGTLTEGSFEVNKVVTFGEMGEEEILQLAASLEAKSEHPIGKAIVEKAKKVGLKLLNVEGFQSLPGKGIKGRINSKEILVVSEKHARDMGHGEKLESVKSELKGMTTVVIIVDNKLVGVIGLSDKIREEAFEAVQRLKAMGIKCYMLTGDNESVAKIVSEKLELDGYFAQVSPEDKVNKIKELQSNGSKVAMVGDGINDAPALTQANLGIAIGAGTDLAIESADIILVKSNPLDIPKIIELSRRTYKKMVENLLWATGYNVIAIPAAAGALLAVGLLLSPAVGAILMSLSTVIVAINAKLL